MAKKLYVGNLAWEVHSDDLMDTFSEYGEVLDAVVITDRETGRSRGFGFVEMSQDDQADAAIRALDGAELGGRNLRVNEARERAPRGGGGGRGGYGGGRGHGGGYGGGGGGRGGRY